MILKTSTNYNTRDSWSYGVSQRFQTALTETLVTFTSEATRLIQDKGKNKQSIAIVIEAVPTAAAEQILGVPAGLFDDAALVAALERKSWKDAEDGAF